MEADWKLMDSFLMVDDFLNISFQSIIIGGVTKEIGFVSQLFCQSGAPVFICLEQTSDVGFEHEWPPEGGGLMYRFCNRPDMQPYSMPFKVGVYVWLGDAETASS